MLPSHQQGHGLELRAHARRHPAALDGGLHLADGAGEHRDDVLVAVAPLVARSGAAGAAPALAWSSHELLLRDARHGGVPGCRAVPRTGGARPEADGLRGCSGPTGACDRR
jgi:hypothetical protein